MILINCQEMDFIELFKRSFSMSERSGLALFPIIIDYSVVTKCCPNVLHHVASLLWNKSCPEIWKVWNHSKGHFQGQKGPMDICDLFQLISQKRYIVWSKLVWITYSKSYMAIQFIWSNLTLDDIERSNQGQWHFSWLFFIYEAYYA